MRRHALRAMLPALLLAGCLTPGVIQPPLQYYMDPEPVAATAAPIPVTLGLRPLMATRPYQNLSMAYLTADGVLAYYANDQWAEMPAALMTRALTDALSSSGRFIDVGDAAALSRPDWQLTGELRKFHEQRGADGRVAVVELRLEMREARERTLLWAATLTEEAPITGTGGQALAAAAKDSVEHLITRAVAAIVAVDPPAAG